MKMKEIFKLMIVVLFTITISGCDGW